MRLEAILKFGPVLVHRFEWSHAVLSLLQFSGGECILYVRGL